MKIGQTFAFFHGNGNEEVISLVKKDDKGAAKISTPSRISLGLTRSGPLALDGSMQETAVLSLVQLL